MQAFSPFFFFYNKSCQLQSASPFQPLPITGKKRAREGWIKPINKGSREAMEQPAAMLQGQAGAWRPLQIKLSVTLSVLGNSFTATRHGHDPKKGSSFFSCFICCLKAELMFVIKLFEIAAHPPRSAQALLMDVSWEGRPPQEPKSCKGKIPTLPCQQGWRKDVPSCGAGRLLQHLKVLQMDITERCQPDKTDFSQNAHMSMYRVLLSQ